MTIRKRLRAIVKDFFFTADPVCHWCGLSIEPGEQMQIESGNPVHEHCTPAMLKMLRDHGRHDDAIEIAECVLQSIEEAEGWA